MTVVNRWNEAECAKFWKRRGHALKLYNVCMSLVAIPERFCWLKFLLRLTKMTRKSFYRLISPSINQKGTCIKTTRSKHILIIQSRYDVKRVIVVFPFFTLERNKKTHSYNKFETPLAFNHFPIKQMICVGKWI